MAWETRVKNGLRFMSSSVLLREEWLEHGVALADQREDSRFNLGFTRQDEERFVQERRERLLRTMGLPTEALVCGEQVHGCHVAWIDKAQMGRGAFSSETALAETDGLATHTPGIMLMTFHADCVPVLLVDPIHRVVAALHAGWKGTAGQIVLRGIDLLVERAGSNPKKLLAAIGPAAGECCYVVGSDLEEPMINVLREAGMAFGSHLNLPEINRRLLLNAGLGEESIDAAPPCTICGGEDYFSFRREGVAAGRMGSWIFRKR